MTDVRHFLSIRWRNRLRLKDGADGKPELDVRFSQKVVGIEQKGDELELSLSNNKKVFICFLPLLH